MSDRETWHAKRVRSMNRMHAQLAGWGRTVEGFTSQPEPRTIGSHHRGRQMLRGNFLFAGHLVEAPNHIIWDLPVPDPLFEAEMHGFGWLDDFAATGNVYAEKLARDWTHDWVVRFDDGSGPGWTPDLAGRRLIRWINHAVTLLNGADSDTSRRFFRALARQTTFLARRWRHAAPGLARFEALSGLIYAAHALNGMERHGPAAARALGRECATRIDAEGGLPTRNPEELMEVFTLLCWAAAALQDHDTEPHPAHLEAMSRIAPALRNLRHSDGSLARFHGGGRGIPGRLDQALAMARVKPAPLQGRAMGFARLSHGRTTLIIDAASPPAPEASAQAHASTLAFELTSGRRPVIVNCGSGRTFGSDWRRAGRATPSHSTLVIDGISSSRLGVPGVVAGQRVELLTDAPSDVRLEPRHSELGSGLIAGHDGYLATHGLTHVRQLYLSLDGRGVQGEDVLATVEKRDEAAFDRAMDAVALQGIPFRVRFHLHPDVEASVDMGGQAVSLELKSGEVWVFRHGGAAELTVEPSVYLESARLKPRATQQIVLRSTATEYATRVSWTLAKARETPDAVRDLIPDDLLIPV